jgi:hypothetical protein
LKAKMGMGNRGYDFSSDRLVQQERGETMERALRDGLQSDGGHQIAEPPGRGMVDTPFDRRNAHIEDEPTPDAVSVSVDDHQPATGANDASHLGDRALLPRVMVKAVGTGDDIKGSRGERKSLAIPLEGQDVTALQVPAGLAFPQHLGHQVHGANLDTGQGGMESGCEQARPATHIKNPGGSIAHDVPNTLNQDTMRRPEEQPLKDAAIVAVTPAGKLLSRLVFVVFHVAASLPSVDEPEHPAINKVPFDFLPMMTL